MAQANVVSVTRVLWGKVNILEEMYSIQLSRLFKWSKGGLILKRLAALLGSRRNLGNVA